MATEIYNSEVISRLYFENTMRVKSHQHQWNKAGVSFTLGWHPSPTQEAGCYPSVVTSAIFENI
jgi:hypothetical protein